MTNPTPEHTLSAECWCGPEVVDYRATCDERYGPTVRHLTAICARPKGHDGEHSNVLPKGRK